MKSCFSIKERVFWVEKCILKHFRLGDSSTIDKSRSILLQYKTVNTRSFSMGLKSTSTLELYLCCNSLNDRPWTSSVPYTHIKQRHVSLISFHFE